MALGPAMDDDTSDEDAQMAFPDFVALARRNQDHQPTKIEADGEGRRKRRMRARKQWLWYVPLATVIWTSLTWNLRTFLDRNAELPILLPRYYYRGYIITFMNSRTGG